MPTWEELGEIMGRSFGPDHRFADATDAISAYEHSFGRNRLITALTSALHIGHAEPGAAHVAFARLGFDLVCTTNFDMLLESAYASVSRVAVPITSESQLAIPLEAHVTGVIKLHGDLHHPDRLIATENDFDGFLSSTPVLATYFANLLITRTPVLIGYSLSDPDLRQILYSLRERLGRSMPRIYALAVDMPRDSIARFARRDIQVVNISHPAGKDPGEVFADLFEELSKLWRARALETTSFIDEEPLEEIRKPSSSQERLCFVTSPANVISLYRKELYPFIVDAGFVPVDPFDIQATTGNAITALQGLLSRAAVALIDVSSSTGSTDLGLAREFLDDENILILYSALPVSSFLSGRTALERPELESPKFLAFLESVGDWLLDRSQPQNDPLEEALRLMEAREFRAVVISAASALELLLRDFTPDGNILGRRRTATLRTIIATDSRLSEDLRARLLDLLGLRNAVLHEGRVASPAHARSAIATVQETRDLLG